ncbi:hydroxyacid dehydrogenase [Virgibacillus necropolis]|uniref:3-phosphoglycerate dehydrogenase n=1 Tax=Virgibacillus necropolis TaxID=163877 RepID=A0A221MF74_9BACI|nr:hydroxyacid dehydrogenase [Virgibacillus necropolis]ASN06272.1 3-phosphoglycerate dehydrogenase [Virgibacillus necropolis]
MKTFIFDPIDSEALECARERIDVVEWTNKEIKNYSIAEAVIVRTFKMTKEVMDKMPKLKIIAKHGVGVDNIDLDYAKSRGIRVTNTPQANMNSVAELVIALALNCSRKVNLAQNMVEEGIEKNSPFELVGFELQNKTVGLIGLGRIGTLVGMKLKAAFNTKVLVYDPYTTESVCEKKGFIKYEHLHQVLKKSDIVSVSVPLTKDTENMISARELSFMKKSAILINTSRGKLINENDLYNALQHNKLFGAAIDAFAEEPVSKDHPLLTCNNFIGTPHNGANTKDALIRMGTEAVDEIVRLMNNEEALSKVI